MIPKGYTPHNGDKLWIVCEGCKTPYWVPFNDKKPVLQWRVVFSQCPKCGEKHNPGYFKEYKEGKWFCENCGVPEPFVKKRTKHKCVGCDFVAYRKNKLLQANSFDLSLQ